MNIVLLCKSWNHGKVLEILEALRAENLPVAGIVALAAAPKKMTLTDFIRKTYTRSPANIFARFFHYNKRMALHTRNGAISSNGFDPSLQKIAGSPIVSSKRQSLTIAEYARVHQIEMVVVEDLNGEASVAALRRLNTDILLLGGVPIIRANVLAAPKVCTLNVHMGLLPKFRGMNVAEWSIFSNAPVGVTVHQVDPGVDTGAILYREEIDVSDCKSIARMRAKVSARQHQALAKCARLLIEKQVVPESQKKEDGKQYYVMHEKLRKIVEKKLSQGYTWLNSSFVFGTIPTLLETL